MWEQARGDRREAARTPCDPRQAEAQMQAAEQQALGPCTPPTWTWRCQLTVRTGRAA